MRQTRGNFARAVIVGLGMNLKDRKLTYGRVTGLLAWMRAESGTRPLTGLYPTEGARYNPLNTTGQYFGSYPAYNSVGVRNYPTFERGVAETVATLQNGKYGPIIQALWTGDPTKLGPAIAETPWGTGSLVSAVVPGETGLRRISDWALFVGGMTQAGRSA